jgi:hypothetical protein
MDATCVEQEVMWMFPMHEMGRWKDQRERADGIQPPIGASARWGIMAQAKGGMTTSNGRRKQAYMRMPHYCIMHAVYDVKGEITHTL